MDTTDDNSKSAAGSLSRRSFLGFMGMAGVAAAAGAPVKPAAAEAPPILSALTNSTIPGAVSVSLLVNSKSYKVKIDPRTTLLDCLRENLNITGTKKGCDHGQCGACTVHINGQRANSCLTLAVMCQGDEITTIEGLGQPGNLHPMQKAFLECDAYQCGYCTSGQIMSATALLKEGCSKHNAEIRERMSGNICRCGAYPNILNAIKEVMDGTS
jgi:xanthine dehydrogenase YagT iron-sulfur-binding subunit